MTTRHALACLGAMIALTACSSTTMIATGKSSAAGAPNTILIRGENLAESKRRIAMGDKALMPAYETLIARANEALAAKPVSVMEKTRMPPTGNKHDYMSMAPYWWPDTTKPNGLPFIRRDGEVYPLSRQDHDGNRLGGTINRVETLALAHYFTGDRQYADAALRHLRVFFLDSATRMNPHLEFGQAVLGINSGRGTGIIESRTMPELTDALRLLEGSAAFTPSDRAGMSAWCRAYLTWLVESKNGKDEGAATNNHGSWYDAQVLALALYAGDTQLARRIIDTTQRRIDYQSKADGKQPRELERTRPLHYSLFNIEALTVVAEMARHVGRDLWHYTAPSGSSITAMLVFVAPYADTTVAWPTPSIGRASEADFLVSLTRAANALVDPTFRRALGHVPPGLRATHQTRLEFPAVD